MASENDLDGTSKDLPRPSMMSRMALNDNKAGMEGLDKEKINQIIYEASKDSKFFENERRKEEQLEARIKEQQHKLSNITKFQLHNSELEANKTLEMLEEERDLSHTIVHVDMDAFYAAVEMRDDPSLQNQPMAVGGMGMLSTSNYLARRFGVRAAMPGFIGLKLCPDLVIVKPNFHKYQAVSSDVREVLSQYDPDFCPMSLDEAYLDLTCHMKQRQASSPLNRLFILRAESFSTNNSNQMTRYCSCDLNSALLPQLIDIDKIKENSDSDLQLCSFLVSVKDFFNPTECNVCEKPLPGYKLKVYGCSIEDAVLEMRNRIEQKTHLTASAGIAPNTLLAKVCSDKNKPNGQYRILPDKDSVKNFVKDLPIRKISGIGKVTEKLLGSLGVTTCSDLISERALLHQLFSPVSFQHFMQISAGIGSTTVGRDGERKSISTEQTFSEINDSEQLMEKCGELCQSLSDDMKEDNLLGKTFTLKIKTVSFEVKTRSITLSHPTNEKTVMFKAAQGLLQTEIHAAAPGLLQLRLMGVRMSKLSSANDQPLSVAEMLKRTQKKKSERSASTSVDHLNIHDHSGTYNHFDLEQYEEDVENGDEEDFRVPLEKTDCLESDTRFCTLKTSALDRPATHVPKEDPKQKASFGNESILKFVRREESDKCASSISSHILDKCLSSTSTTSSSVTPQSTFQTTFKSASLSSDISQVLSQIKDVEEISMNKNTFDNKEFYPTSSQLEANLRDFSSNEELVEPDQPHSGMVSCPICSQQRLNWPLDELNTHIDICLSKETVKDILQKDNATSSLAVSTKGTSKRNAAKSTKFQTEKKRKLQPSVMSYFKS